MFLPVFRSALSEIAHEEPCHGVKPVSAFLLPGLPELPSSLSRSIIPTPALTRCITLKSKDIITAVYNMPFDSTSRSLCMPAVRRRVLLAYIRQPGRSI